MIAAVALGATAVLIALGIRASMPPDRKPPPPPTWHTRRPR